MICTASCDTDGRLISFGQKYDIAISGTLFNVLLPSAVQNGNVRQHKRFASGGIFPLLALVTGGIHGFLALVFGVV